MSPFYDRKEEDHSVRWTVGVVAALCLLTAGWLLLSGPGEERLEGTHAFDQRGPMAPPRTTPRAAVERRTDTGLSMVSTSFDAAENPPPPAEEAPAAAASASAPGSGASAPAAAPAAPADPAADAKQLAAAGLPSDDKGLQKLGATKGLFGSLAAKVLDHPRVIKALLNNKLLVDAYMSRDVSRANCSSKSSLQSYLSDTRSSGGLKEDMPILLQVLSRPQTAAAVVDTEMGRRIMACPSVSQMTSDPGAMMSVAMSNPDLLKYAADPRVTQALSSSPQAMGMFSNVQAAAGGLGAKP